MGNILHMSDFHFGRNPEVENERLESLARFLNKNEIEIQYLVFTGDIVDAFEITIDCILHLIRNHPLDFNKTDIQTIRQSTDKIIMQIQVSQEMIDEYNLTLKEMTNVNVNEKVSQALMNF